MAFLSEEAVQLIKREAAVKAAQDACVAQLRGVQKSTVGNAQQVLHVHRIILGVALALLVLLPVYAPLIRKINTSVEVEANTEMGELDLDDAE